MWIEKRRSWIEMVALGGFALPHIWMRTLTVTAISLFVTVLYEEVPQLHYSLTTAPFTIVGLPLGIFLGFRNNTAYDRFWEGRKLWGALVNTSRSFTRQILTLIDAPPEAEAEGRELEQRMVRMAVTYVHALKLHLRDLPTKDALVKLLPSDEVERVATDENVPLAILQRMGDLFVEARRKKWIDAYHVPVLEGSLTSLTDIQGACERIKSTPIPYSYTVLMHRIVAGYCVLLPFGLMETIKWATPVVVLAISYCLFGMDAIGDEIEQPFGFDTNDLPLDSISNTIERNLRQRIGDPLPEKLAPKRGVLT
jgi:ion channel-forming bestrophin family protein